MPKDFDVFRCNQFYFEDKYYLGKNIKAVMFATQTLFEQIYTMQILNYNKEYIVDSIFINDIPVKDYQAQQEFSNLFARNHFIHSFYNGKYSHNISEFLEYSVLQHCYFGNQYSTGMALCALAVALGYREIYLAGIDFYQGKTYAFDTLQSNILHIMPGLKEYIENEQNISSNTYHTQDAELNVLTFLSLHYNAKFYCLCPNSPMSKCLELATITHNNFIPESKIENYTKDILLPPRQAYEKLDMNILNNIISFNSYKKHLENNIAYQFFNDLVKLPNDIRRYIKGKRLQQTPKDTHYTGGGGGKPTSTFNPFGIVPTQILPYKFYTLLCKRPYSLFSSYLKLNSNTASYQI